MALHWNWNECIGEATFETGQADRPYITVNLYQGNALLLFLHQFKENGADMWSMYSFWVDKDHMKNCLGLTKGNSNIYKDIPCRLASIKLNKETKYLKDIVSCLIKAFDNIQIKIYSSDKENEDV